MEQKDKETGRERKKTEGKQADQQPELNMGKSHHKDKLHRATRFR